MAPAQLGKWLALFCDEINLPDLDKYCEQWRRKMIQEGGVLVKGCSKSDAIWVSFMGSFAILGGLQPPQPPPIPTPMVRGRERGLGE